MSLITLQHAHLAFGHVPLLDDAQLSLEAQERVGLIGRNGTGKSSLLKVLAGLERLDDGELRMSQGLRLAYVAQDPALNGGATGRSSSTSRPAIVSVSASSALDNGGLQKLRSQLSGNCMSFVLGASSWRRGGLGRCGYWVNAGIGQSNCDRKRRSSS